MLPRAMNIARLALAFGRQTRATYHEDGIRKETDTDHTVMLSLLVADLAQLPSLRDRLDLGEVLSYALVHDVVEAYAGDTVSIRLTAEERAAKKAREAAALERLRDEFGADAWLVRKIESYERQDTLEARFVHFADKIVPKFTHAMNGGRTMRDLGFDLVTAAAQHTAQLAELAGGSPDLPEMAELFHEAHEAAIQGMARGLPTIDDLLRECQAVAPSFDWQIVPPPPDENETTVARGVHALILGASIRVWWRDGYMADAGYPGGGWGGWVKHTDVPTAIRSMADAMCAATSERAYYWHPVGEALSRALEPSPSLNQTPTHDMAAGVPRHLRSALASAARAFTRNDLASLATVNEHLQPVVDAAVARIQDAQAEVARLQAEVDRLTAARADADVPRHARKPDRPQPDEAMTPLLTIKDGLSGVYVETWFCEVGADPVGPLPLDLAIEAARKLIHAAAAAGTPIQRIGVSARVADDLAGDHIHPCGFVLTTLWGIPVTVASPRSAAVARMLAEVDRITPKAP